MGKCGFKGHFNFSEMILIFIYVIYFLGTEFCVSESRADIVWPLSSPVVTSCVSPATEFLALALENNNIIIWNNYFGECLFTLVQLSWLNWLFYLIIVF